MLKSKETMQHGGKDDKYKEIHKRKGKPGQEFF